MLFTLNYFTNNYNMISIAYKKNSQKLSHLCNIKRFIEKNFYI